MIQSSRTCEDFFIFNQIKIIMKKLFITALLTVSFIAYAQYSLPAASPRAKVEQQFSVSKVTVDYGRPGVKGRKIFGDLVPYNKVWRAGANSSSKITFGQAVNFGGKSVAAGTYGLFVLPTEKEWKVILNKDSQSWGTQYDEKLNVTDVTVPVQKLSEKQEWFEIALNPVDDASLEMILKWDNVKTVVPIKVDNPDKVNRITDKLKEIRAIEREK